MSGDSTDDDITSYRISRLTPLRRTRPAFFICLLLPFLFAATGTAQIQSLKPIGPASALPDAPTPQIEYLSSAQQPCRVISRTQSAGAALVSATARLSSRWPASHPLTQITSPPGQNRPLVPRQPSTPCPGSSANLMPLRLLPGRRASWPSAISSTPLTPSPSLALPPFPSAPIRTRRTAPA